jgi:hypothetical protein
MLVRCYQRIVYEFARTNSKKNCEPVRTNWYAVRKLHSEFCDYASYSHPTMYALENKDCFENINLPVIHCDCLRKRWMNWMSRYIRRYLEDWLGSFVHSNSKDAAPYETSQFPKTDLPWVFVSFNILEISQKYIPPSVSNYNKTIFKHFFVLNIRLFPKFNMH